VLCSHADQEPLPEDLVALNHYALIVIQVGTFPFSGLCPLNFQRSALKSIGECQCLPTGATTYDMSRISQTKDRRVKFTFDDSGEDEAEDPWKVRFTVVCGCFLDALPQEEELLL
jgi:hypothetical protein